MTVGQRYARHVALSGIGEAGQERINRSSALIVGLGGLGCPAALYLATSGIGSLVLNDFDRVDETNLPRQVLFDPSQVGENKAQVAAEVLHRLNPDVAIESLSSRLSAGELREVANRVDMILDCTDNFATRLAINQAAVDAGVQLISGAALRYEGQLYVFPNRGDAPCYRCLYSEDDELLGSCQGNGVLAPVPGVIGALMAVEALLLAAQERAPLTARMLLWDGQYGEWQTLELKRDPACPVCGAPG